MKRSEQTAPDANANPTSKWGCLEISPIALQPCVLPYAHGAARGTPANERLHRAASGRQWL